LSERSVRVPFSADSADADGCERMAIFLIRNSLVARKEQVRLIRYEGKRALERKLLDASVVAIVAKDGNATHPA
jgi:ribosomal protein S24E